MKRLGIIGLLLAIAICAAAVGTVTRTEDISSPVKKVTWYWTSDTNGEVIDMTAGFYSGKVLGVASIPSSASAPAATHDIYIYDAERIDLMRGGAAKKIQVWGRPSQILMVVTAFSCRAANMSSTATAYIDCATQLGTVANDRLILHVTNAGEIKAGTVSIWIR